MEKKLKVTWTPDLEQDLDALTAKGFMFYNEELTNKLIAKYGSVDAYKQSEDFKKLKDGESGDN